MPKHKKKAPPELSPWRRATVDVAVAAVDAVSGALVELGALGLEIEDDETRAVPGRASSPTGRAAVTATFSRAPGLEARVAKRLAALARFVEGTADLELSWADLFPEDWNAAFRAQWKPFRCGLRTWVCPSWERANFRAERVGEGAPPLVLYLDAGMAFGTGTHETTQLCIEAIEALPAPPRYLLDVGTGTGILSLAALKLGAARARGTDIDPVAVHAALDHAKDNAVTGFTADARAPDVEGAIHDVVVANILAGTLLELRDAIVGALARGGRLFLSGVLVEQERAVREGYLAAGLTHLGTATKNGWVRIDLRR
ncbi:MAG: 50S ribosomal protein L11 methyltransferase [Deltaproteobacteria bacterium]|nr:50S ribosomal protein L11 methyltransferase [Deltaproteobacteria bacterium]